MPRSSQRATVKQLIAARALLDKAQAFIEFIAFGERRKKITSRRRRCEAPPDGHRNRARVPRAIFRVRDRSAHEEMYAIGGDCG
jgi:hypothetical protein